MPVYICVVEEENGVVRRAPSICEITVRRGLARKVATSKASHLSGPFAGAGD